MSDEKKDGAPVPSNLVLYSGPSMPLRDWFAGMAVQGMLAHPKRYKPRQCASSNWHEAIAEEAFQLADAMLAERARGTK